MSEKNDNIIRELGFEPVKTKSPQPATPSEFQGRDGFQTPNYAVDLLIPFIPKDRVSWVWEPASGDGRIVRRLLDKSTFDVFASDLRISQKTPNAVYNFLTGDETGTLPIELWEWFQMGGGCIITNPPFSLKKQFYLKCREFKLPFALLVPADYSGWIIKAAMDGAEKIIPTRRVDYITPNILTRIHEGEVWEILKEKKNCNSLIEYKKKHMNIWITDLWVHHDLNNYDSIDKVPVNLLSKYSSSDFHSMWLTWGFELGKTETFVELSIKDKKENI